MKVSASTTEETLPKPRYDPGRDRQRLDAILAEFAKLVETFCRHDPLLNARITWIRRRCGKSPCRCTRGMLHQSLVLVDRSSHRRTIRKIPSGLVKPLRRPTAEYRRFRQCLIQLKSLSAEARGCALRLRAWRLEQGSRILRAAGGARGHG